MQNNTISNGQNIAEQALKAELARLQAENAALKAAKTTTAAKIMFKVSEKGGVSVYGLGRFPVTLYASQWERLLDSDTVERLKAFLVENKAKLAVKEA